MSLLPVTYVYSKKSWMNSDIMNNYVKQLDLRMRAEKRNIILLLDNAPSHPSADSYNASNVRIHFLPPNTTAFLQPMDAGIIRTFKAHYRKLFIRHIIQQYDTGISANVASKLDIKQAIDYIAEAMEQVTSVTIRNCWARTKILPIDDNLANEDHTEDTEQELVNLIERLGVSNPMSADSYLTIPGEKITEEILLDERQIATELEMQESNAAVNESSDSEQEELPVTYSEALAGFQIALRYLQQQNDTQLAHIKIIKDNISNLNRKIIDSKKQKKLDSYFQL